MPNKPKNFQKNIKKILTDNNIDVKDIKKPSADAKSNTGKITNTDKKNTKKSNRHDDVDVDVDVDVDIDSRDQGLKTKKTNTKTVNSNNFKIVKKNKNAEEDDKDSSMVSDIDDDDSVSDAFKYDSKQEENNNDNIDADARNEYAQKVVCERVVKYIMFDDLLKKKQAEHRKEVKTIKEAKEKLEQYLVTYLDKVDEEFIKMNNGGTKLVKTETKTKSPPKMEDISVCLTEGFKKYELYDDDNDIQRVVKEFIEQIDAKRAIKTRKFIKRMEEDKEGKKKPKKAQTNKDNDGESKKNASTKKNTSSKKITTKQK